MPLLRALQYLADGIVRTVRVIVAAVSRSMIGISWLARLMLRLRAQASGGAPAVTRLLDLHAVVLAADVSLLTALLWATGTPGPVGWSLAAVLTLLSTVPALWLLARVPTAGRPVLGATLVVRAAGTLLAAQWLDGDWPVLLGLAALVLPQWALHLTMLRALLPPGAPRLPVLWRATAYGLLAGLVTGVFGLVAGWLSPTWPLWPTLALLIFAALLVPRLPSPSPGLPAAGSPRPAGGPAAASTPASAKASTKASPPAPVVPPQPQAPAVPDGFHVYRPSSLDPRDEPKR